MKFKSVMIKVTLAEHKASKLDSYINVKRADKYLQFGLDSCKEMPAGKLMDKYYVPRVPIKMWELYNFLVFPGFYQ